MNREDNKPFTLRVGEQLRTNKFVQIAELVLVFLVALIFIQVFGKLRSDNLIVNQAIIWVANIIMLLMVWAGLRLRGETWQDFGLGFKKVSWKEAGKVFLLSLLVFVLALVGFVVGSIIMANITGIPQSADMSSYDYLKDNIGLLLLSLAGVYIVSSFGEEVIYRAFLINRISAIGGHTKAAGIIAVILSAVVFGLAHYSWGPMGIVQTGFMGLALGWCYIFFNKRLWILILAHAYMDTILMLQLYFNS